MPFDGVVLKSVVHQLKNILCGGKIEKIYMPENDEIILNIRNLGNSYKLLLCSNSNMPRVHITSSKKVNPQNAPNFCMVLRKHLHGSKIIDINSFGFERIFAMDVECYSEMQDKQVKRILVEIMGKHSNIILINENNKIIDSIKHVDHEISSIREIMPARTYTLPPMQNKVEPDTLDTNLLLEDSLSVSKKCESFLLDSIMGFSPFLSKIICNMASINPKTPVNELTTTDIENLKITLNSIKELIVKNLYNPCIFLQSDNKTKPPDFYCFSFDNKDIASYNSISEAIEEFYIKKDIIQRQQQKKSSLLKHINNSIEKVNRKIQIYTENLKDLSDMEKYKLYGDLILAFIHSIPPNADKVILSNFYSNDFEDVEVPLDPTKSPQFDASRYFKKYHKAKNTFVKSTHLLNLSLDELKYLENVQYMLESAITDEEITEIRNELSDVGIIHKKNNIKNKSKKSETKSSLPYQFISSDGYDIFVGKNNIQNDRLTLKDANSVDIWLHTKDIPGSHVIIKKQKDTIPESTILEAAILAAFYSKARLSSKTSVDYTLVKYVKKPSGAKPGMVIYTNHKTILVSPDEEILKKYNLI